MSDKTTKSKAKSAGAKVPADRLAKAEATREPIHVDYKGIEFDIPPEALEDFRAFEALDAGNPFPLFRLIVGDHKDEVYAALEDENGRVPIDVVTDFMQSIVSEVGAGN